MILFRAKYAPRHQYVSCFDDHPHLPPYKEREVVCVFNPAHKMEHLIKEISGNGSAISRRTWDDSTDSQARILKALNEIQASLKLVFSYVSAANASHDHVAPPPAFHLFPKLPPEIRHKIWTCLFPKPQYRVHSGPHGALFDRPSSLEVLSLLSICSESRAIVGRRFGAVRLLYWADGMVERRMGLKFGGDETPLYEWVDFKNDVFAMKRTYFEPLVYHRGNAGMLLSMSLSGWRHVRKIAIDQVGFAVDGPVSYFTGQDSERVTRESVTRRLHRTGICSGALRSLKELHVVRYTEEIPFKPWLRREHQNLQDIVAHAIKWLAEGCQICQGRDRMLRPPPKIILAELPFPLERMTAPDLLPYDASEISDDGDDQEYPTFYSVDSL